MNSFLGTLSFLLMVIGAVMAVVSRAGSSYSDNRQTYRGKATATVVDIVIDEPDRRGREKGIHDYYYAVFAYYADGILYKKRYDKGGNPCPFVLNQKIPIRYSERRPERFCIREKSQMNYISTVCYFGGLFLCIVGVLVFVLASMRIL